LIPNLIPPLLLALAGLALALAARAIVREVRRQKLEEEAQFLRQCPELLEIVASGKHR
jgi:type II secretory pathway pseudopilin PulG